MTHDITTKVLHTPVVKNSGFTHQRTTRRTFHPTALSASSPILFSYLPVLFFLLIELLTFFIIVIELLLFIFSPFSLSFGHKTWLCDFLKDMQGKVMTVIGNMEVFTLNMRPYDRLIQCLPVEKTFYLYSKRCWKERGSMKCFTYINEQTTNHQHIDASRHMPHIKSHLTHISVLLSKYVGSESINI